MTAWRPGRGAGATREGAGDDGMTAHEDVTRLGEAAATGPVRLGPGLGLGLGLDGPPPGGRPLGEEFDDFSPYPPIADYGFLSDCEVTALVAPSGAVEWMCLPRMDCPSIFGALLDRDAGWFRFGPEDMAVPADR